MWKGIVAGTAALAIAGSSLVYAQQRGHSEGGRWQPNIEDMRAFGEARIAGLKAGLGLNAEQEKNWPAFEQAARELAKLRADRITAMHNAPPATEPAERLRRRAAAMTDAGAALKKLADATDPLYKSLDEGQKRRFAVLSHLGARSHGEHGRGQREGGHRWGPDRMGDRTQMEHPGAERL